MFVKVERDFDAMSERAAQVVAEAVRRKPNAVLGLATGSTPTGMYGALIRIAKEEGLDFSRVTTFNLDEIEGPVTSQVPASALQMHPWVIAVSDTAAASKLKNLPYYQHVDRELADQPDLPPWIVQPSLDPRHQVTARA